MPQQTDQLVRFNRGTRELREDHEADGDHDWCPRLDRRAALRLFSMTTVAAVAGCGSGGTATTAASTSSTATTTAATTTTLAASASTVAVAANLTLTSTVSPAAATGTVTFYDGTTSLGTGTLSAGTATLATKFTTAGAQSLTATYAGSTTYAASTSSAVSVTVTASTTACSSATLEGEEGPYFVDDSASGYLRTNILSNLDGTEIQAGIPLTLTLYVFDSENSCAAMQNVQVDIWHCNAKGVYSAESVEDTVGQSWLRGYQLTDVSGKVEFKTIVPGWYQGRTTHIHLRLRSTYDSTDNAGTNTMQLFFDQTTVDTIDTTIAPYSTEGKNSTTNTSDHVYTGEESGTTLMTITGDNTNGYAASFNIYLPIKNAS